MYIAITRPFSHQPSISTLPGNLEIMLSIFYSLNFQVFLCLFLTCDFFSLKFNVNYFRLLYRFFSFLIWRFFSPLWFHEFWPVIRIFQLFDLKIFLTALISRIFLFFQNWAELQTGTEFLFFPTSRKRFKNRMKKKRADLIRKYKFSLFQ